MNGKGKLYVVATPIGNLEDLSYRAVKVLSEVSLIAAEDTRQTRKLLTRYNIKAKLISYHEHNEERRARELSALLSNGEKIALVSDSGTPGISDPGYRLIRSAANHGIEIVAIPGASAIIAALSISALPTDSFLFAGFLPRKKGKREQRLRELKELKATLIFYEAPHRIERTLAEIEEVLGDREAVLTRELTKIHEEVIRGKLSSIREKLTEKKVKGEITLIVAGERKKRKINEDEQPD
jgi:16S rRNA (cytidine1402-2'-O)-methyltransferase